MTVEHPIVMDREAGGPAGEAFAIFSADRAYRYVLGRRWAGEGPTLAFVMLNPSTADAFTADPTVRRCLGFARGWGYAGLLVLNIFALRSTDPKALYSAADPVGPMNDALSAFHLGLHGVLPGDVVCAWGAHGALAGRGAEVARILEQMGRRPACLGRTKAGHPRHPLYLPAGSLRVPFST